MATVSIPSADMDALNEILMADTDDEDRVNQLDTINDINLDTQI